MTASAQQQARIFDTTLSSIPDFTYIFDRAGRFTYANKSLLDLLGLKLSDIVGKNFFELPVFARIGGQAPAADSARFRYGPGAAG